MAEDNKEAEFYRFITQPNYKKLPADRQVYWRARKLRDLGLSEAELTTLRANPLGLRIADRILPGTGFMAGGYFGGPVGAGLGLQVGEMGRAAVAKAYGYPARIIPTAKEAESTVLEGILSDTVGRLLPPAIARLTGLTSAERAGVEAGKEATQKVAVAAEKARETARTQLGRGAQSVYESLRKRIAALSGKGLEERQTREGEQQAIARLQTILGQTPAGAHEVLERPKTATVASGISAVRAARQRGLHELGGQIGEIFKPIDANLVDLKGAAAIGQHVRQTLATSAERGERLAPSTEALAKEIDSLTPKSGVLETRSQMDDWLTTGKTGNPQLDAQLNARLKTGLPVSREELAALITEANQPPTIAHLRGLNSRVLAAAERAPSAIDRRVLLESSQPIRDMLDNAVPDVQKPALARLKAEYRQLNKQLSWSMMRKVNKATTLPEIGDVVFFKQRPDRALRLIQEAKLRGDPFELYLLRQAFASRVLTQGSSSFASLEKALAGHEAELTELFGVQSPFGSTAKVLAAGHRRLGLERQLRSDPQALADYREGIRSGLQDWLKTPATQALLRMRQTRPDLSALPLAIRQGQIAALQARAGESGFGRYLQHRLTFDMFREIGAIGVAGYGGMMHEPGLLVGAGAYLLRRHAWAKAMENPDFAGAYRDFLFSPSWQTRGRIAARLLTTGVVTQAVSQPLPDKEAQ